MTPPASGVRVLGVDEHVWHHQDRRRRGPRELTGIVDLTRGEDHPTARLLDLVPGRSGTAHENWLEERGEQFRSGIQIATLDPFQGQQERHRLACSETPPASTTPFTSSNSLATLSMRYVAASTPASAANPPSNTNYTKRPGQKPHKQTVNNLRTTPVEILGTHSSDAMIHGLWLLEKRLYVGDMSYIMRLL